MRGAAYVFIILVLALLYQGEALKCHYCKSRQKGLCTPTTIQTCSKFSKVCGAYQIPTLHFSISVRGCMTSRLCSIFKRMRGTKATCCTTDLCN